MANLLLSMKSGKNVFVDTANAVCRKFGWRHGDRFVDALGNAGEVMGAGPCVGLADVADGSFEVLWVILDKDICTFSKISGYASYYVNHGHTADASACMRRQNPADLVDDIFKQFGPDYR